MPNYTVECAICEKARIIFRSLSEHGNWPICCGWMMHQVVQPPQLVRDIEPYRAVASDIATGKAPIISGRRQHNEFMKRNNYVELGNEKPRLKPTPVETVSKHDIKRAIQEVKSR